MLDIKKLNSTAPDAEIVEKAKRDERIVLTLDKDFIVLTQYPKYQVPTIVIRLKRQQPKKIAENLEQFLNSQKASIIKKSLTIITEESAESYQC